jgi:preprotein translocase subunit SecE
MAIILKKNPITELVQDQKSDTKQTNKVDIKAVKKQSLWQEIKESYVDISWPTIKQTWLWFLTTLFICFLLGFIVFYVDNIYKAAFNFVECSSPKAKNQLIIDGKLKSECFSDLPKQILNGNK